MGGEKETKTVVFYLNGKRQPSARDDHDDDFATARLLYKMATTLPVYTGYLLGRMWDKCRAHRYIHWVNLI